MTHDDVRDVSTEYVLGALDAAGRAAVDRHLDGCADCRAFIAGEARIFDALGRGVEQVPAPPALRDRVLRAALAATPTAGVPDARITPRRRAQILPWMLAAAAAVIALVTGWQLFALQAERERLASQSAEQQRVLAAQTAEQERALAARTAEQQRSLDVLGSADLVRFDLRGDATAAPQARAFWSHRHGMVFTAQGLAPVPAGRTYQLWVISGGKPISAGVFAATPAGEARIVMPTPETLTEVEAVAVTIEPAGGLDAPSTTPILVGAAAR